MYLYILLVHSSSLRAQLACERVQIWEAKTITYVESVCPFLLWLFASPYMLQLMGPEGGRVSALSFPLELLLHGRVVNTPRREESSFPYRPHAGDAQTAGVLRLAMAIDCSQTSLLQSAISINTYLHVQDMWRCREAHCVLVKLKLCVLKIIHSQQISQ